MSNPNLNRETPSSDIRTSLTSSQGHGNPTEKRGSVGEVLIRLRHIISILPEDSKRRLGNQADLIRKNPEEAVEVIRNEVEAARLIIDMLNDKAMTTDEALIALDKLLPKNKSIQ